MCQTFCKMVVKIMGGFLVRDDDVANCYGVFNIDRLCCFLLRCKMSPHNLFKTCNDKHLPNNSNINSNERRYHS